MSVKVLEQSVKVLKQSKRLTMTRQCGVRSTWQASGALHQAFVSKNLTFDVVRTAEELCNASTNSAGPAFSAHCGHFGPPKGATHIGRTLVPLSNVQVKDVGQGRRSVT